MKFRPSSATRESAGAWSGRAQEARHRPRERHADPDLVEADRGAALEDAVVGGEGEDAASGHGGAATAATTGFGSP